jgi:hypothetical protein
MHTINSENINKGMTLLLAKLGAEEETPLTTPELVAFMTLIFSLEPINIDRWEGSNADAECQDFGRFNDYPEFSETFINAITEADLIEWQESDWEEDEEAEVGLVKIPEDARDLFGIAVYRIREIDGTPAPWVAALTFLFTCLDVTSTDDDFLTLVKQTCIDGKTELLGS